MFTKFFEYGPESLGKSLFDGVAAKANAFLGKPRPVWVDLGKMLYMQPWKDRGTVLVTSSSYPDGDTRETYVSAPYNDVKAAIAKQGLSGRFEELSGVWPQDVKGQRIYVNLADAQELQTYNGTGTQVRYANSFVCVAEDQDYLEERKPELFGRSPSRIPRNQPTL